MSDVQLQSIGGLTWYRVITGSHLSDQMFAWQISTFFSILLCIFDVICWVFYFQTTDGRWYKTFRDQVWHRRLSYTHALYKHFFTENRNPKIEYWQVQFPQRSCQKRPRINYFSLHNLAYASPFFKTPNQGSSPGTIALNLVPDGKEDRRLRV